MVRRVGLGQVGSGRSLSRSLCPSLTVAAEGTQSARCSDIKEAAAEAPSPSSCSPAAGGSPAPRPKA